MTALRSGRRSRLHFSKTGGSSLHRLKQIWWGIRALALRPFFGSLGMPSYLGPSVFLLGSRRIYIGKRVRIFPGMRAEAHRPGKIFIHDDVAIGQAFHITAIGDLHIGAGTLISGFAMVTDIDHEYRDISLPVHEQPMVHSRTELGKNCFIGMRSEEGLVGKECVRTGKT